MSKPKITPINRNNKFFSQRDFELEIEMGREAIEGDGNFKVVLYRVDRTLTPKNIYGEAGKNEVVYMPPVELSVMPLLDESEYFAFNRNAGSAIDQQDGNLAFSIYEAHLTELGVDVSMGDYIGYQVTETELRYFSVVNDGKKNYDNKHTIMGYKGAYRIVNCAPVDYNEFQAS